MDLSLEAEEILIKTLKEYMDMLAWSYKDLKSVNSTIF